MKQKPAEGQRPEMYFEEGGMPETVSHQFCHSCAAKQEHCQYLSVVSHPVLTMLNLRHTRQGMGHAICCCKVVSTISMAAS